MTQYVSSKSFPRNWSYEIGISRTLKAGTLKYDATKCQYSNLSSPISEDFNPHVAKLTKNTAKGQKVDIFPHASYSSNLYLTDFHFFRSLEHFLGQKNLYLQEDIRTYLLNFFREKQINPAVLGLQTLPDRWVRVAS